jgi:bifunctional ADP-heptose synthase (sugar kinase/adenylyltransferase)
MKILVIGEYCVDKFIYCDVNRLSPEAPVPVLLPKYIIQNDGMAGNVLRNLGSLTKVEIKYLFQDSPKIIKTRYVDDKTNHMFFRVDENDANVSKFELTNKIKDNIVWADAVIVSDYNKGFLSQEDLIIIGNLSKLSILDTKKVLTKSVIKSFDFVKLNEKEFLKNKESFSQDLIGKLIITLGKHGAKYLDNIYESPNPKDTIDVSGAGDTFISAFTIKFLETNNVEQSIVFANEKCSIVVGKKGVAIP